MIAIREKKSFPLGKVLITPPAEAVLQEAGRTFQEFLEKHASGDWGEIDADDWNANEEALASRGRVMSVYAVTDKQKVWIITEADRSATTLLLPDDY
jgi:hypothetical protein